MLPKSWPMVLLLASCVPLTAQEKTPERAGCIPYGGIPKPDVWIDSTLVATNRPYRVSADREKALREAYPRIEIGMSRASVEKVMGRPDFENVQVMSTAGKATGVCVTQWAYIFRKGDTNLISLEDAVIYLSFSANGQLFWTAPQNLDLKPKGSPVQK